MEKNFDMEKVKKAQEAVGVVCLHCGDKHTDECPVHKAMLELKKLAGM